jgi:hypothetical protein
MAAGPGWPKRLCHVIAELLYGALDVLELVEWKAELMVG